MATRTADPPFYTGLSAPFPDREKPVVANIPASSDGGRLDAFRGLGFAIAFEILFAVIGIGAWEIIRRLF